MVCHCRRCGSTYRFRSAEGYVKDLRRRDSELAKGGGQIATPWSKPRAAFSGSIAPTPGLFHHSNVHPFAQGRTLQALAGKQVGYERVKEIEES